MTIDPKILADVDDVLAFSPATGGTTAVAEVCARLRACIERVVPSGSTYRRMADAVPAVAGKGYNREDQRLRGILSALRQDLVNGNIAPAVPMTDTSWLATTLTFPTEQFASHAALLTTVERGFALGREARVLVVLARETSGSAWTGVFGRIDLVRPGDPALVGIAPRGNVRLVEERPGSDVVLARLEQATSGGDFIVGDVALAEHGMAASWNAYRHNNNPLDYGTRWPCVVLAPSETIKNRLHMDGAIEADGPIPVFMGLDRLAWAASGFRQSSATQGIDIRPRRFQVLLWDYRGRVDRFRSTGKKVLVTVYPPGDPALKLVAVAEGANAEKPLVKMAPSKEEVILDEPILRARVTLKHGDDVLVEHSIDLPGDAAFARLQGQPPASREFGEEVVDEAVAEPPVLGAARAPGNWILSDGLGEGGQGLTFVVFRNDPHPQLGVIKLPRPWAAGTTPAKRDKALARFRREIEVTQSLDHAFILKVLDAQRDGDTPWMVTEYIPFGSLQHHLSVFRGDVWRSLRLARDVAVALGHLHGEGLVHRDVKPSNILLRALDHAVLGDFGIVYDPDDTEITSIDEKVAAKWYGPPEADAGLDEPPPNFDTYSLGKVIYTMLSGGGRFVREEFRTEGADLARLLRRPDLEAVNALLDRMIVRAPSKRFQCAAEIVEAIDRTLSALFGNGGGSDRCRACGQATYVDRGSLAVDTGGLKVGGQPMDLRAFACPKCGDVRLADAPLARKRVRT